MEQLLTKKQAADMLGISLRSFEKLVAQGHIAVVWVLPTKRMIEREALQAYVEKQRTQKPGA